jgi:oligoribonuclease NrnB/cAMP/cGMP phosphodiesterase (DHH superfamily)
MISVLCFYHAPCNDGSAAAAALRYRLRNSGYNNGDYELIFCPLTYTTEWDQPLPEEYLHTDLVANYAVAEIFIVDLSMSRVKHDQIITYLRDAGRIGDSLPRTICIDHHQTALDKLDEIGAYCDETYIEIGPGLSGATLVWKYFNQRFNEDLPVPSLLKYVADQDVWEWKLEDSRAINAALNVLDGKVETMIEELQFSLENEGEWRSKRLVEGNAIVAMVESQVMRSARMIHTIDIGTTWLALVNATSFSSELGNYLCEHSKHSPNVLAVIYSIQEDWSIRCSIRSIAGGATNARAFAEQFGGGGHDHAAGCRFPDMASFRKILEELEKAGSSLSS